MSKKQDYCVKNVVFGKNGALLEGMDDFYNQKVRELFDLEYLFPWQRLVVANTLESLGYFGDERQDEAPKRSLVVLPTGAGKSLCFMMPGLLVPGITVILFPLLALMADQERRLLELGEEPALFKGGQSPKERENQWEKLRSKKSRFILTNPETLGSDSFLFQLSQLPLAHLVIDEVHTVPQWGSTFREGLLNTGRVIALNLFPVVTAFTATASPHYRQEIGRLVFGNEPYHSILANPDRPNIGYHILYTSFPDVALEELCLTQEKPILVFCSTRAQTEESARFLTRRLGHHEGVGEIRYYHAGLEKGEKQETETWFIKSKEGILFSTCAYGMGIDKKNLRTLIHRDIPLSVESYIQEAGRAGRSGDQARAIMIVEEGRESEGDLPAPMAEYISPSVGCRREKLMEYMGSNCDYCGDCDRCTPLSLIPQTEIRESRFRKILKRNSAVFTKKELIHFLKGYGDKHWLLPLFKNFGLFEDLESNSIEKVFERWVRKGWVQIPKKGLWKRCVFFRDY